MLRPVRLRSDSRNGRLNPPQNVTVKASFDLPRMLPWTSERLLPRDKMCLICLGCLTHQPIELLAQKLPSNVRAFGVSGWVLRLLKALIYLILFQYSLEQHKLALRIEATRSERLQGGSTFF